MSFDRIFCDLHCIKDAVKAGDQAILKTLEKAVHIMGRNMDMLLEYHVGSAKDEILDAIDQINGGKSLVQRAHRVRDALESKFDEMHNLLMRSNLDASGHETTTRAL